jgi:hypothetical protein
MLLLELLIYAAIIMVLYIFAHVTRAAIFTMIATLLALYVTSTLFAGGATLTAQLELNTSTNTYTAYTIDATPFAVIFAALTAVGALMTVKQLS